MERNEVVLPDAGTPAVVADQTDQAAEVQTEVPEGTENAAPTDEEGGEKKPEKHPLEKELAKERRRISNLAKRTHSAEQQLQEYERRYGGLTADGNQAQNRTDAGDTDTVTLSRAQLQDHIRAEASRIAPTLTRQQAQIEQSGKVVDELASELGREQFNALALDLEAAVGKLADGNKPTSITEAIFKTANPKAVIKYLADVDNADEAAALRGLSGVDLGIAIANLRIKAEAALKPARSKVPAPLEPIQGSAPHIKSIFELEGAAYAKARRKQLGR